MNRDLKFLLITPSFKRPYMLRSSILNSANQTYTNFHHSIMINYDEKSHYNYEFMFDDIISKFDSKVPLDPFSVPQPLKKYIVNYKSNEDQHENHIKAIFNIIENYPEIYNRVDYIVKWDDDDIYKSNYLKSVCDYIHRYPGYNIYTTKASSQLNNYHFRINQAYGHLGGVPNDNIGMPATMIFDRTAAEMIMIKSDDKEYRKFRGNGFEDTAWFHHWHNNNLKFKLVDMPNNNFIWHIHGGKGPGKGNISTSSWLDD